MAEKKRFIPILALSNTEAKKYFLKTESYCGLDLPDYFDFSTVLKKVDTVLAGNELKGFCSDTPRKYDDVNHTLYSSKDGKYAWRPFQIINPAIYVSLVDIITTEHYWKEIQERFELFGANNKIECLSIPLESMSKESDRAEQITHWWHDYEQKSLELTLEYDYMIQTDITDCYGSIYTHTIAWAMHSKETAKEKRNDNSLIGNIIDSKIQDMCHGQTNSIPQGSSLMDFIAEIILGSADLLLSESLKSKSIEDYRILRYRDDYRILTNNPSEGEVIIKTLTEILIDLGLKINSSKTFTSGNLIKDSIKKGKLSWAFRKQQTIGLEKHILIIHDHAENYPNSGSLAVACSNYFWRLKKKKKKKIKEPILPMIAIATDIAYNNPRTYPIITAILSHFLSKVKRKKRINTIEKIIMKFKKLPNTGFMNIWLQRITLKYSQLEYDEPLCKIVAGESIKLWNDDWISSMKLKQAMDSKLIVDKEKVAKKKPVMKWKEIALYTEKSRGYYE